MSVKNAEIFSINQSIKYLKILDPSLILLLNSFIIDDLVLESNYFKSLTRSIIYQQLSGKAAKTISNRFITLYRNKSYPSPIDVVNTKHEKLLSAGLSNAKACYINNIAQQFMDNPNVYDNLGKMNDDDIVNKLTGIKGIGLWTAQMFLIFSLNRPDIMPATDLGIQKGFQYYYKLKKLPTPTQILKKSMNWTPYRTVVSLYLWRILEGPFDW